MKYLAGQFPETTCKNKECGGPSKGGMAKDKPKGDDEENGGPAFFHCGQTPHRPGRTSQREEARPYGSLIGHVTGLAMPLGAATRTRSGVEITRARGGAGRDSCSVSGRSQHCTGKLAPSRNSPVPGSTFDGMASDLQSKGDLSCKC